MKSPLRLILSVVLLASGMAIAWQGWSFMQFVQKPMLVAGSDTIMLEKGESVGQLARQLYKADLIDNKGYFRLLVRISGQASKLKAGEYEITAGMTVGQLLDRMAKGDVIQRSFTIIEGWNIHQLRESINQLNAIRHLSADWDDARLMSELGYPGVHPEGRFFPETYRYTRGDTDIDILRRAAHTMDQHLARVWQHRDLDLPLKNETEALILASIVEKETGRAEERPMIAGVFINRLRKGMRLQTDPTVIYGMGADFDGNIRKQDLLTSTPYNTYRRNGLTPTPISMPSLAALQAAVNPAQTDAIYFVATGNGGHHFSSTLEEHNRAVRKYQLKR